MKKLVKKSNNTYVVAINSNDKNIKRKRYYLIDNLIYANKIGILSQYEANQLCDFVMKNNLNNNKMLTDKVYDRAMPIDINDKGKVFTPIEMDAMDINYSYLDQLFSTAMQEHQVSEETLAKIEQMDDYTIKHFRIAFGNRIVAHMKKFVPVFVACGGDEIEGVDYFMAKKVLRKFEQLNISYIRDEITPYIDFLDKTFGKGKMKECIDYMMRLKKLT